MARLLDDSDVVKNDFTRAELELDLFLLESTLDGSRLLGLLMIVSSISLGFSSLSSIGTDNFRESKIDSLDMLSKFFLLLINPGRSRSAPLTRNRISEPTATGLRGLVAFSRNCVVPKVERLLLSLELRWFIWSTLGLADN